jgi:hypothetical protein
MIAAFAAALMLAVGVPGVASATGWSVGDSITLQDDGAFECWEPGWDPFPAGVTLGEYGGGVNLIYQFSVSNSDTFAMTSANVAEFAEVYDIANITPSNWSAVAGNNYQLFTTILNGSPTWANCFFTEMAISNGSQTFWALAIAVNTWIIDLNSVYSNTPTADPLTTTTPTLKRNGISFTPDNYDPTCAYEISTSAGTAIQNPVTGEVNVYGVGSGSSVTVTITDCTGATATVSGKATAATAPVQTLTKPTVATTADAITCSAGTSTVNPTSVAFTLLVDGVAVSTRFSDGAIAPSLVATTAAQNFYTGATLSKASWTVEPAWAGKSYSCTTTSYAAGAVGIANS